ncbi:hypothetical protein Tco_0519143 [Tanacetum coccineum]
MYRPHYTKFFEDWIVHLTWFYSFLVECDFLFLLRGFTSEVWGWPSGIRELVAATEPKTIQKAVQIFGALTDDPVRNGSIKKVEKIGNVGELSKDKNGRDDNKRNRNGNAFATTQKPCRKR